MTPDQIAAFVRQMLPIVGTLLTVFGVSASAASGFVNLLMEIIGPLTIVGSGVWAHIANSRKSIMTSAAQPVSAGVAAPQIILPREEAPLANALPANVTTR